MNTNPNTNPNTNRKLFSTAGVLVAVAAALSLVAPATAVADSPWDRGTTGGHTVVSRDLADGGGGCGAGSGTGGGERDDDSPWD
jgi:hypothetical protein